jgi:hypothetical protein
MAVHERGRGEQAAAVDAPGRVPAPRRGARPDRGDAPALQHEVPVLELAPGVVDRRDGAALDDRRAAHRIGVLSPR